MIVIKCLRLRRQRFAKQTLRENDVRCYNVLLLPLTKLENVHGRRPQLFPARRRARAAIGNASGGGLAAAPRRLARGDAGATGGMGRRARKAHRGIRQADRAVSQRRRPALAARGGPPLPRAAWRHRPEMAPQAIENPRFAEGNGARAAERGGHGLPRRFAPCNDHDDEGPQTASSACAARCPAARSRAIAAAWSRARKV